MTCAGCAVECWDFPACPELVDRDLVAAAEARGLAFAGADHQPDPTTTEHVQARLAAARQRTTNRARYGDGGLFDRLEEVS